MGSYTWKREQEIFRALLREVRIEAGLTQEEVAKDLKRPQSYVSKVESGERRMDVIELRDICKAVGINPSEFMVRLEEALSE